MVGDLVVLVVLEVQVVMEEDMEVDMAVEVMVVLVLVDLQIIGRTILAISPMLYKNVKMTNLKQLNKSWNQNLLMKSFLSDNGKAQKLTLEDLETFPLQY